MSITTPTKEQLTEALDMSENERIIAMREGRISYAAWSFATDGPRRLRRRAEMERDDWTPEYSRWRHGGSYVTNITYPSGAVGCIVSERHSHSGQFEIACPRTEGHRAERFRSRADAARRERQIAIEAWKEWDETTEAEALREWQEADA